MSLDFYLYFEIEGDENDELFSQNITHNLNIMADHADIYKCLWRPKEIQANKAKDIIQLLEIGIAQLRLDPAYYKQYNPENGWGNYEILLRAAKKILNACKRNPEALIDVNV